MSPPTGATPRPGIPHAHAAPRARPDCDPLDDLRQTPPSTNTSLRSSYRPPHVAHDVTVEQLEHDQAHTEITRPLDAWRRGTPRQVERADRILPYRQVGHTDHLGETHVQCKQFAVITVSALDTMPFTARFSSSSSSSTRLSSSLPATVFASSAATGCCQNAS